MTASSFELGFLDTAAGQLPFVRHGVGAPTKLLILQPLFEERNRLRRLLASVSRGLAHNGIESWMVDLPGTGDSPAPTASTTWPAWRTAAQATAQSVTANPEKDMHILSVRGGCLLDDLPARSLYRFAPVAGDRLLRELMRARVAADDGTSVSGLDADIASGATIELAGYAIPASLAMSLRDAKPTKSDRPLRTATVGDGAADIRLDGPPLWRQAEPGEEPMLSKALADDVLAWISTSCSAR